MTIPDFARVPILITAFVLCLAFLSAPSVVQAAEGDAGQSPAAGSAPTSGSQRALEKVSGDSDSQSDPTRSAKPWCKVVEDIQSEVEKKWSARAGAKDYKHIRICINLFANGNAPERHVIVRDPSLDVPAEQNAQTAVMGCVMPSFPAGCKAPRAWVVVALDKDDTRQTVRVTLAPQEGTPGRVDMAPYMERLQLQIKQHWSPPRGPETKHVTVLFNVHRDGHVSDVRLKQSCGSAFTDMAALAAVNCAGPFERLPAGCSNPASVSFKFDYNVFESTDVAKCQSYLDRWQRARNATPDLIAKAMQNLATAYAYNGKFDLANQNFDQAMAIIGKAHGRGSIEMMDAVGVKAFVIFLPRKDYVSADKLLQAAQADAASISNERAIARVECLRAGLIDEPQKRFGSAEQLFLDASKKLSSSSEYTRDYSNATFNLCSCYMEENKDGDALALLDSWVKAQLKAPQPDVEQALRMAMLVCELRYLRKHDAAGAMSDLELALNTCEAKFGETAPQTLRALEACTMGAQMTQNASATSEYKAKYNSRSIKAKVGAWERIIAAQPSAENLLGYGMALENEGQVEDAEQQYKKALALAPSDQRIQDRLAHLQATNVAAAGSPSSESNPSTADTDNASLESQIIFLKALPLPESRAASQGKTASVSNDRKAADADDEGIALMHKGDYTGAIVKLVQSMSLSPSGSAKSEIEHNYAIAENNLALTLSPEIGLIHMRRALFFDLNNSKVCQNLENLLRLTQEPDINDHVKLAENCIKRRDFSGAVVEYRLAQNSNRTDANEKAINDHLAEASDQIKEEGELPRL